MRRLLHYGIALALLCCTLQSLANTIVVVYPKPMSTADARMEYPLHLLRLGFDKAGIPVQLHASADSMSQSRALKLLGERTDVDVVWTMTTKEREAELLPVRIPIYKGLIGWRVALLAADRREQMASVLELAQLRPLIAGQGHDWPDTAILKANQLTVNGVSNYESLFKMLAIHRVDYFPRAIVEIEPELNAHQSLGLTIDPYVLLHYPTASYFFFHPDNAALAAQLENGLNLAIKDGSFDQLFRDYHQSLIAPLNLHKRRIIELSNPLLPEATPLQRKELWFDPMGDSAERHNAVK